MDEQRKNYCLCNGFVSEIDVKTLEEAFDVVDKHASYCQAAMYLRFEGNYYVRKWWGCNEGIEESENPISFGEGFGHYSDWEEIPDTRLYRQEREDIDTSIETAVKDEKLECWTVLEGDEAAAKDEDWNVRLIAAANPNTPKEILAELAKDKDRAVRICVAESLNIPEKTLFELAKDHWEVREAVAANPNTPKEILAELAKDGFNCVRLAVAEHKHTSEETLAELAKDDDAYICCAVARNLNTSAETLAKQAKEEDSQIRFWVAQNPNTSGEVLKKLVEDEDLKVREAAAKAMSQDDLLSPKMSVEPVSRKKEAAGSIKMKM